MYNKRYKKSNKKIYGMCTIIVLLIYTISICYSTLQQQLEINGLVKVRRQENIRVTGVEVESSTKATSNWEEYDVKNVSAGITLPNAESSITYKVKVTNFGNVDMGIYNIDGLDNRLTYTIEGYELKDKIEKSGNKREFKITIKYKDGSYDASNTDYNILLNFEFRAYYKVTYKNFPSGTDNLPKEVMERDKLIVDLKDYQNARYKITENEITLPSDRYTYINNELTISSVEGDIEITYKKIPDIELVLRDNDSNKTLSEDIQAGMYRYQGSYEQVKNNYICFGTSSKDECLNNKDKYMYRIIGITEDGQLELIKMTALNDTGVQWNSVDQSTWNTDVNKNEKIVDADVPWSKSDLYKRLNGLSDDNIFINSTSYDYMQKDSIWYNKIADTNWLSGQIYTTGQVSYVDLFKLPTIYEIESGQNKSAYAEEASPYYYNGGNTNIVVNTEPYMTRRTKDSVTCERYDEISKVTCYKNINEKFNDKVTSKIGLMHAYEFDYSVEKNGKDCLRSTIWNGNEQTGTYKDGLDGEKCKASWMHISNNDTTVTGYAVHEWTMSRAGFIYANDHFDDWYIRSKGYVNSWDVRVGTLSTRPVFYLTTDIILKEETTGTKDNPYIIDMYEMNGYIDDLSGNNNYGIANVASWDSDGITTSDKQTRGFINCGLENHDFENTITMITRVKFNDLVSGQYYFGNWQGAGGGLYLSNSSLKFEQHIGGHYEKVESNYNISLNTYYTIVGVYNGSEMSIYIDGQKIGSSVNGNIKPCNMPILLGANPEVNMPYYNYSYTTFTDALIFDTALSDAEIQKDFSNEIDKDNVIKNYVNNQDKKLLLYYRFV